MLKRNLMVNGIEKTVIADPETSLADVLREQLLLTGTKVGCGKGQCGACNVILNGKLVRSCIVKMSKVPDQAVLLTIEGIGSNDDLDPIQLAWMLHGGAQCGFCTPGFIVSTKALLAQNPKPVPGRYSGMVHDSPQCLSLHRLQTTGGRGNGCRQSISWRNKKRGSSFQDAR